MSKEVTSKCCVSCIFCYGQKPKISFNGQKVQLKTPKNIYCHGGTNEKGMLVFNYNQMACAQYKPINKEKKKK